MIAEIFRLERPADSAGAIPDHLAAQQRARLKAIRRVRKLREKACAEIERLILFLDASDPYVMTELEQSDGDDEPSLGRPESGPALGSGDDREQDDSDDEDDGLREPSLGSLDWDNQTRWGYSARADLEEQCDDEGSAA